MQYKVPQDVQREDTIVGPITLKQLIILGIGGGIAYAIYVSLAKTYYMEVWLPPVAIVSAITLAFAFLKIYGLSFHVFITSFITYHLLPKKRVWVQGAGDPFLSSFQKKELFSKKEEKEEIVEKNKESIKELTDIVDAYGKKQELQKMVDQNYKNNK